MGAIVDPSQKKAIAAFVEEARREGAEVYQTCASMPSEGCYYPPTLITNVQPVSRIVMEEVSVDMVMKQFYVSRVPQKAL